MKFKKLGIILATAMAGAALVTLSGCSSKGSTNADIITMKGDTIQVTDLYNEAKEFPNFPSTTLLQQLTFDKMFDKEFKGKVTDKDVTNKFNEYKKQYGSQFDSALQQQGLNETNLKSYLKTSLLTQYAIDQDIKKTQYTDANMKNAWSSYHPQVTAIVLSETTKDAANKAIAANKSDASKFDKDNSKSEMKFDSTSTTIPTDVLTAAWKLKNGEISSVITSTDSTTGATAYYVVKMVKSSDKGKDMNKYKSELQNIIKTQKEADSTYTAGVIADYLKKNNVTVKENSFSTLFQQYTQSSSSSSK